MRQIQDAAVHFMNWNLERVKRCLDQLSEEELWARPNENTLSVGNQLLHLEGNIRQWVGSGLAGREDARTREREFDRRDGADKATLFGALAAVVEQAVVDIEAQQVADLRRVRSVQVYEHDGAYVILHVVEHFSYHVGQLVFWTKQLRNRDMNFYPEVS